MRACPELLSPLQTTAPNLLSSIHTKPELPTGWAPWEMGSRVLRAPLGSGRLHRSLSGQAGTPGSAWLLQLPWRAVSSWKKTP